MSRFFCNLKYFNTRNLSGIVSFAIFFFLLLTQTKCRNRPYQSTSFEIAVNMKTIIYKTQRDFGSFLCRFFIYSFVRMMILSFFFFRILLLMFRLHKCFRFLMLVFHAYRSTIVDCRQQEDMQTSDYI